MPPTAPSLAADRRAAWGPIGLALVLGVLTLACFQPVLHNDFIKFDDRQYVTENPHVVSGLTWKNVKWAFQTGYASNWHPLTWISHMVDVQLFGLNARGHHLTSLLLHVANTLLLFGVLWVMTQALWRSAVVAALFAVHPLHVESVAWVAERKDVLSTFFFLLMLWCYARYAASQPGHRAKPVQDPAEPPGPTVGRNAKRSNRSSCLLWYGLALVAFACGLMSKPMLVTVPFLLLLLDWWPLGRLGAGTERAQSRLRLVGEKVPFLLLTVASSIVTFLAQAGSHSVIVGLPLRLRVANAIVSYAKYLGKTFWPANLAIFYPHPNTRYNLPVAAGYPASEQWPVLAVVLTALWLAGICWLAFYLARRRPWLVTGWFWFGGMLVPVIGLVQVGMQGLADRYTYTPLIGIFICLVWETSEWLRSYRLGPALGCVAALAVLVCAGATYRQAGFWRTNLSVFQHALKVTQHNAVALCNVGEDLAQQGKLAAAQEDFRSAAKADPRFALAYVDLAISLEVQGEPGQAIEPYEMAVRLRPWNESARLRLADILKKQGRTDEALAQYRALLELNPAQPRIQYEVGALLAAQNKTSQALSHFQQALQLKPDLLEALVQMGTLLAGQGKFNDAQPLLRQAVALCPTNALLRLDLGKALMLGGQSREAAPELREAARLAPGLPDQFVKEGKALCERGQLNPALASFNTALWLKPDSPAALSGMAWILATHPVAKIRNGPRALRLAQRALELGGGQQASTWAALDAAFAETGRYAEAIAAAEKARDLALANGDRAAAQACDGRLALYRSQQPYHQ